MRRFIETLCKFNLNPEDEFSKDVWGKYTFDANEVTQYNESEEGFTTITIDGQRSVIAIKYGEFVKLIKNVETIIDPKIKYQYEEQ